MIAIGFHVTTQAPGAPIANGTRVRKVRTEPGDANPIGTEATVLGSLGPMPADAGEHAGTYGYFVEWDTMPGTAVFVIGEKIEPL